VKRFYANLNGWTTLYLNEPGKVFPLVRDASHPVSRVRGEAVFAGSELIRKRPSGATAYCQLAMLVAAILV
jgi:hypothetical protein